MKVSGLRHVLWRLRSRIALVLTEIHQAQAPLPRPFLLYFYRKLMRSTVGWPLDPGASRHPLLDAFHSRFRNVGLWLLALPSRQTPQVPTVSRGRLRSNTAGAFYGLR